MSRFWDRKIPALFLYLLLFVGLGVTTFIVQQQTIFRGGASPNTQPTNMQITNLSDTAFTVVYITQDSTTGTVNLKQSGGNTVVVDDRDKTDNIPKPHRVHSITITNLTAETTYDFEIISDEVTYSSQGKPFQVKTAPTLSPPLIADKQIRGEITLPDSTPPQEALVVASTTESQLISTLSNSSGVYILHLEKVRSRDLINYIPSNTKQPLILTISGDGQQSRVITSSNGTMIPLIILSKDYDFTLFPVEESSVATTSAKFPVNFQLPTDRLFINAPRVNQQFVTPLPVFSGSAPPVTPITIVITGPYSITTSVRSDLTGGWRYRAFQNFPSGTYIFTASATVRGAKQEIRREFIVAVTPSPSL